MTYPLDQDKTPPTVGEVLFRREYRRGEVSTMRNKRDALNLNVWDKVKRVRAGVKAIYGDDSSQYQMVGGTRMSDRKSPTRRMLSA